MREEIQSIGVPSISRQGFISILQQAESPAAAVASACYDVIVDYGVDPAFALAIFCHESSFGTAGRAVATHNWGNLRWGQFADRNTYRPDGSNEWAWYAGPDAWIRSARDCARLLRKYADGRMAFEPCKIHDDHDDPVEVFYHWAPTGDGGNKPSAYAQAVIDLVRAWRRLYPAEDEATRLRREIAELEVQLKAKWEQLLELCPTEPQTPPAGDIRETATEPLLWEGPAGHA